MLPKVNPIDTGCVPRGWPIDHLGRRSTWCPRCEGLGRGKQQPAEVFQVICGSGFGFGAPFFVRPFLKHTSTAGKMGKRGKIEQCVTCNSVYLDEEDGTAQWWADATAQFVADWVGYHYGRQSRVLRVAASNNPAGQTRALLVDTDESTSHFDVAVKRGADTETLMAALREDGRTALDGLQQISDDDR